MTTQQDLFTFMAIDAWNTQIKRTNKLLEELTDEQLQQQVADGRNTGVYILGHLTAVHDSLLPLFGFGVKLHPELEDIFIKNPDKSSLEKPSVKQLREYWNEVNGVLALHFSKISTEVWLQKHNSVSAEDFAKEPHRNKLNVLLNRTSHIAYHLGQLVFLKEVAAS